MTSETLEIETVTTLRGPLAAQLVKLADELGMPPVEVLADLVEESLDERKREAAADRRAAKRAERFPWLAKVPSATPSPAPAQPSRDREAEQLLADLKRRALAPETLTGLAPEARRRKVMPEKLAELILRTVVADNLFAAVIDTGDAP